MGISGYLQRKTKKLQNLPQKTDPQLAYGCGPFYTELFWTELQTRGSYFDPVIDALLVEAVRAGHRSNAVVPFEVRQTNLASISVIISAPHFVI